MKRRIFAFLLTVCLLIGLLPAGASAVELSSADQKAIDRLLSVYEWYGENYNCTDAAAVTNEDFHRNLLEAVVVHPSCVYFSDYSVTFTEDWRGTDPQGRWKGYSMISSADADWILKNIFHCTDADIAVMRNRLSSSRHAYYQNGRYYAFLGGVGGGFYTKNMQVYNYGKLYLIRFEMYDIYGDDFMFRKYAVVGKSNVGGKDYWTLYYWNEKMPSGTGFLDVNDDAYYAPHVSWAVRQGITKGLSGYIFGPDEPCTRAQAVTFLWRAAGSPTPVSRVCPFRDASRGAFYYTAMLWAAENGIVKGLAPDWFGVDEPCTRAQIVTFLYRAAGSPAVGGDQSKFTDVPKGCYYEKAVRWAVEHKITSGTSATQFSPNDKCTRAQMVTFLHRFMQNAVFVPKLIPIDWLGNFYGVNGERIEVKDVTENSVTFEHLDMDGSRSGPVLHSLTLPLSGTNKTEAVWSFTVNGKTLRYIYRIQGNDLLVEKQLPTIDINGNIGYDAVSVLLQR